MWRIWLAAAAAGLALWPAMAEPAAPDPYLWLEEVTGARALAWVAAHNQRYLPELEAVPGFAGWQARALDILQDPRRIAYPSGTTPEAVTAALVFNFWRDAQHPRGLWRVAARAGFDAGRQAWQTLLDLDALEARAGANLQFAGADCLAPDFARCMVRLSVGGRDAVQLREFDVARRQFVDATDAFHAAEAKQATAWLGPDRLLIASARFGATDSGYAREVRLWRRGTPLDAAPVLLRTTADAVAVDPAVFGADADQRALLIEALSFWTARIHHLGADGQLQPSPLPLDADFRFIANVGDGPRGFALLRTDFAGIPAGSLVAYAVAADGTTGPIERLFTPNARQTIESVQATGQALYLGLLDNVAARLERLRLVDGGWQAETVPLPANSSLRLVASDTAATLYANVESFTAPARLIRIGADGAPAEIARAPAFFDGSGLEVRQYQARSADGTHIPYFVVRSVGAKGALRTLLWSYGGFEIALTPSYLTPEQQMWVEGGNQYVVANIRGGGEFGPKWHQAAVRAGRQRSYDDLHAVAADLKARGLAAKIAVSGRSNGGLMASVAFVQRPDLYDAALVGVPLADMKRYHRLLAGASWMAEYGNPDTADWEFIRRYSPYQNLRPDAHYPRVFFYTSTKDDRVHPGHARKMAARMEEQGHPIYYYENVDGGHAGVADLRQSAYRIALMLAYLNRELR